MTEIEQLRQERDALLKFKNWVHAYLDSKGVPTHPDGPHSRCGCRIGDRMDLVFAELTRLRTVGVVAVKLAKALEMQMNRRAGRCTIDGVDNKTLLALAEYRSTKETAP